MAVQNAESVLLAGQLKQELNTMAYMVRNHVRNPSGLWSYSWTDSI